MYLVYLYLNIFGVAFCRHVFGYSYKERWLILKEQVFSVQLVVFCRVTANNIVSKQFKAFFFQSNQLNKYKYTYPR